MSHSILFMFTHCLWWTHVTYWAISNRFFLCIFFAGQSGKPVPGTVSYQKHTNSLAVCCKVWSNLLSNHSSVSSINTQFACLVMSHAVIFIPLLMASTLALFAFAGWLGGFQSSPTEEKTNSCWLLQWLPSSENWQSVCQSKTDSSASSKRKLKVIFFKNKNLIFSPYFPKCFTVQ